MCTDAGSEMFSVEVHHGGFFVGHGHLRSYVNGKLVGLIMLIQTLGLRCG
jgi:hypothetical protein